MSCNASLIVLWKTRTYISLYSSSLLVITHLSFTNFSTKFDEGVFVLLEVMFGGILLRGLKGGRGR